MSVVATEHIIAAGILNNVIGALWFGPLFARPWINAMNEEKKSTKWADENLEKRGFAFLMFMELCLGTFRAWILSHGDVTDYSTAVSTAIWLSLGFQATAVISSSAWEDRPTIVTALSVTEHVICAAAQAALMVYLTNL
eukprot:CFRG0897T1